MSQYINVIDANGLEDGIDTGKFRPATHRVLIEDNNVYGADNFQRHFRDKNGAFNRQEWVMFLNLMVTLPTGSYGELSWEWE